MTRFGSLKIALNPQAQKLQELDETSGVHREPIGHGPVPRARCDASGRFLAACQRVHVMLDLHSTP
jgi:hypothetical protein